MAHDLCCISKPKLIHGLQERPGPLRKGTVVELQVAIDSLPQRNLGSFVWTTVHGAEEAGGDRVALDAGDICAHRSRVVCIHAGWAAIHMCVLSTAAFSFALQRWVVQRADGKSCRVEHGPSGHQYCVNGLSEEEMAGTLEALVTKYSGSTPEPSPQAACPFQKLNPDQTHSEECFLFLNWAFLLGLLVKAQLWKFHS